LRNGNLLTIIYDFDGTITKPHLAKYLIIDECGYENGTLGKRFLDEIKSIEEETHGEVAEIMNNLLMKLIKENNVNRHLSNFNRGQETIDYNEGVLAFFDNINRLAKEKDVELKHYIITGGFRDYIVQLPMAKHFTKVFGSTLALNNENNITGMKQYLTYSMKIDAIKEINDSNGKAHDDCTNTVYIGDGLTDRYAMEFVHENGGKTIFVHQPGASMDVYNQLNQINIVDYCFEANYNTDKDVFKTLSEIVGTIQ